MDAQVLLWNFAPFRPSSADFYSFEHFLAKKDRKHTFSWTRQSSCPAAAPRPFEGWGLGAVSFLWRCRFCRRPSGCRPNITNSHISISCRTAARTKRSAPFLWSVEPSLDFEAVTWSDPRGTFQAFARFSAGWALQGSLHLAVYPVTFLLLNFLRFNCYYSLRDHYLSLNCHPRILRHLPEREVTSPFYFHSSEFEKSLPYNWEP